MRVFLTGGTGLIGRRLVPCLLAAGHEVECLSRDPQRARTILSAPVEFVGGEPTLPGVWQDRAAACDAVVNLAGESVAGRWSRARKSLMRRSRLGTTARVVEALANARPGTTLVNASATGYYGDGGERALGEDSEPGRDFLARLALEWEHSALQAESEAVRVVLIRLGVVLDPSGGALPRMLRPFRLGLGGPLGSGRQYFPWIHSGDLVQAILFVLQDPALSGPVNAVVPDPPTQRQFARALGRAVGRQAVLPVPAWGLRILLGEQAEMVLASQRAVPNVLKARGFKFGFPDLDTALADLLGPRPGRI